MDQDEAGNFQDAKHLLDLFELLYHWHEGAIGHRTVLRDVDKEHLAGCSDSLTASYAQLRSLYVERALEHRTALFEGYTRTLAQSCVIELNPDDEQQCKAFGELIRPNFAQAPLVPLGRRWLEDAVSTAWQIAVPDSAEQQRGC